MTLFHLWDLSGDVLAAPESASGLDRCNISLSLSHPRRLDGLADLSLSLSLSGLATLLLFLQGAWAHAALLFVTCFC